MSIHLQFLNTHLGNFLQQINQVHNNYEAVKHVINLQQQAYSKLMIPDLQLCIVLLCKEKLSFCCINRDLVA